MQKRILLIGLLLTILLFQGTITNAHHINDTLQNNGTEFYLEKTSNNAIITQNEKPYASLTQNNETLIQQPVISIIEEFFEGGISTIQEVYDDGSGGYNFSLYDNVAIDEGGELNAEALSLYWQLLTGNVNGEINSNNMRYLTNTLKKLNSSLVYDSDTDYLFLPIQQIGSGRYSLSIEANLYFSLDCMAMADLLRKHSNLLNVTGLEVNNLVSTAKKVFSTIYSQKGSEMFNATNGLLIPVWEYNETTNLFYSSFTSYKNSKTSIYLTALLYVTYLSLNLSGESISEDEAVFSYKKYIYPLFNITAYTTGSLLMNTEFSYDTGTSRYVNTKHSSLKAIALTSMYLQTLSDYLKNSNNNTRKLVLRSQMINYGVDLIGGVTVYFRYEEFAFMESINANNPGETVVGNVTSVSNGIFFLTSLLSLDYFKNASEGLELKNTAQRAIQLSIEVSTKAISYLKTMWDENMRAFLAGIINDLIIPFEDYHLQLNLGVSNSPLLSVIVLITQLKLILEIPGEVIVGNPIPARIVIYRANIFNLFPFYFNKPVLSQIKFIISSDSLNAYYETIIYPSDINQSINTGLVYSSNWFNFTPSAENEGPNEVVIQLKDFTEQLTAQMEFSLFVIGHMIVDGEIKTSDGQSKVTRGVTQSISLNYKVTDRKGNPVPDAEYSIVLIPQDNQTQPSLYSINLNISKPGYHQKTITGTTNQEGKISLTISVSDWNSSHLMLIEVVHPSFESYVREYFIPFIDNNLILFITNADSLDILEGEESTRIQYTIKDLFGNVPNQAVINVSMIVDNHEYYFAKGLQASGEIILSKGKGSPEISISDLKPGEYELIFKIGNTLFNIGEKTIELTVKFIVSKRAFLDLLKYQLDRLTAKWGWLISALGGVIGFLGAFRNPIKKSLGISRKCYFCGEYTSTKYPVCKNCGRTIDPEKEKELLNKIQRPSKTKE